MDMTELFKLIDSYPEWVDDLDETSCPTGWVYCPLCDGGGHGYSSEKLKKSRFEPQHSSNCLRLKYERYKQMANPKPAPKQTSKPVGPKQTNKPTGKSSTKQK